MRKSQIERDLLNKLHEDIQQACIHFTDMCNVVDVPQAHQVASVLGSLATLLVMIAQHYKIPKARFLATMSHSWNKKELSSEGRRKS